MLYTIRIYFYGVPSKEKEHTMEEFIVNDIYPLVDTLGIDEYHVLYELMSNGVEWYTYTAFLALRVSATFEQIKGIESYLDKLSMKYDILPYSYIDDACNRITRKNGINDYFETYHEGWITSYANVCKGIEFAKMLSCFGKCSRIIIDELHPVPKDSWLLSVMIHLILNSLGLNHNQEKKVRDFPFI